MSIRKLAGETVVYGLSSILGRFANFLLVPLYTWILADREFGDIAYFYALMGFLKVLFTLQLDTAFFRFGKDSDARAAAYTAILRPALGYITLLGAAMLLLAPLLAGWTGYPGYEADFRVVALILMLDAFAEFPLARLRLEQRPLRFAGIRLAGIGVNILLNVLFLWALPSLCSPSEAAWLYPESRLGLVLLANLGGTLTMCVLLVGDLRFLARRDDQPDLRPVLRYAAPLILVSLAGVVNEMIDRQLLRYLLPGSFDEVRAQIGIYSAGYRLAMVVAIFTQAFRYAAEPFFFRHADRADAPATYARVAGFYNLAASLGLLSVLLFQEELKYFIGREGSSYHEALSVLPVLLTANLLLGLYYNFSVWYKLTDRTGAGALVALGGALLTVALNVLFIPDYGYHASAWATLACYAAMCAASLYWGQRHYPVPYPLLTIALQAGSALLLGLMCHELTAPWSLWPRLALSAAVLAGWSIAWGWSSWRRMRTA